MKATKSPGIAIVLPADKDVRATLLGQLQLLLQAPSFDAQLHLVEAVYVVDAGNHSGAKEGETLVLLDSDGKRVAGGTALQPARSRPGTRKAVRDRSRQR